MDFQNKINLWHFFLMLISVCCFLNALENDFVHDDIFAIKNNMDIRPETSISNLFMNDFWGTDLRSAKSHKSYRPLCSLTFRLNYMFNGLEPFGYHLVNVALHLVTVNLFFHILNTMVLFDSTTSGIAALVFATHPVHVEAVTGVVGRADVLSCILFLLTFYWYTRYLNKLEDAKKQKIFVPLFTKETFLALLFGSMCLFTKEHSVTIFGVCLAYDIVKKKSIIKSWLFRQNNASVNANEALKSTKRIVFITAWVIALFLFRLQLMGNQLPPFKEEDNPASFSPYLSTRVLTYLYLLAFNAQLLLAPYMLNYDWQVGSIPLVESLFDIRNISTLCFIVIMITLVLMAFFSKNEEHEDEVTLLGVILLVVPFLPASNFFLRVGFVVAERILYIPSLGFCILVSLGLRKITKHVERYSKVIYALVGLMVMLFCMKAIKYNTVWKSRETLFKSGVVTLPHNAKVHYNYANFLKDHNRVDEAIYHYKEAVKLYPIHSSAHNNLGTILKDPKEAEYHLLQALKHTPGHYRAMYNLASLRKKSGNNHEAEELFKRALQFSPDYKDVQFSLAQLYHEEKRFREAEPLYEQLRSRHPSNDDIFLKYAEFLSDSNRLDEAMQAFQQMLQRKVQSYIALLNIGKIYRNKGQSEDAVKYYKKAITMNPTEVPAYQSLASFLYNTQNYEGAEEVYEMMIKSCKPQPEQWRNYAVVLFTLKQYKKAISIAEDLIAKDKNFLNAHYTLVNFLMQIDQEKALPVIEKSLQVFPGNQEILLQAANAKRSQKDYNGAKEIYLELISKNSQNFHALFNVGTIYHIEKDLVNADKYYKLAKHLNPNDSALVENIKKLKRLQQRNQ